MDDFRHWLELSLVPGVGAKTFLKLLDEFSDPKSVLGAPRPALQRVQGVGSALADAISRGQKSSLEKSLKLIDEYDVTVLTLNDPAYPELLKHIHDPPPLLYVRGSFEPADRNAISVVGSRRASHYGKTVAGRIAGDLARIGFTVVSGLNWHFQSRFRRAVANAGLIGPHTLQQPLGEHLFVRHAEKLILDRTATTINNKDFHVG